MFCFYLFLINEGLRILFSIALIGDIVHKLFPEFPDELKKIELCVCICVSSIG